MRESRGGAGGGGGGGGAAPLPAGTGSTWNGNSYHWEEKPLTGWAKERLRAALLALRFQLPCGSARLVSCDVTGEASATIRE